MYRTCTDKLSKCTWLNYNVSIHYNEICTDVQLFWKKLFEA